MVQWKHKIYLSDIFALGDDLTQDERDAHFPAWRDAIVQRLRESDWYQERETGGFDHLDGYIRDLADSQDLEEFNEWWGMIYDLADLDHDCWIDTISPVNQGVRA